MCNFEPALDTIQENIYEGVSGCVAAMIQLVLISK